MSPHMEGTDGTMRDHEMVMHFASGIIAHSTAVYHFHWWWKPVFACCRDTGRSVNLV